MKLSRNSLVWILVLYIFLNYTAQETLIPPVIHSVVMYTMVLITVVFVFFDRYLVLTAYTRWYVILIALSTTSFIYAQNITTGTLYTMFVALVITFCMIYIIKTQDDYNMIVDTFIFSSDILCILLAITGQIGDTTTRLGGKITGNANSFSALLMVASVFMCWKAVFAKYKRDLIVYWGSFALNLIFMALSGGRKTIIAVIICLVYFMITREGHSNYKTIENIVIIIVGLYFLNYLIMNVPILYRIIGGRFEALYSFLRVGSSSVSSDRIRYVMIENGINAWKERPILGYGLDNYRFYNAKMTGRLYYAHNNYVELLYDLGIIGFFVYYGFFIYVLRKLRSKDTIDYKYRILANGLLLELMVFDIGGVSYYQVMCLVVLCLAFITTSLDY